MGGRELTREMMGLSDSLEPEEFLLCDEDGIFVLPDLHPETGDYIAALDRQLQEQRHNSWLQDTFDARHPFGGEDLSPAPGR